MTTRTSSTNETGVGRRSILRFGAASGLAGVAGLAGVTGVAGFWHGTAKAYEPVTTYPGPETNFERVYKYLAPDSTFLKTLPQPPKRNEPEAAMLVAMKSQRTPAVVNAIRAQAEDCSPFYWLLAGASPEVNPKLQKVGQELVNEATQIVLLIKGHYNRTRPHLVRADINPVIAVPWHAAYPSGHATLATLLGLLFTQAYPTKAKAFKSLGQDIARNREIAGLHYPSDTAAGYALGLQFWNTARPTVIKALA